MIFFILKLQARGFKNGSHSLQASEGGEELIDISGESMLFSISPNPIHDGNLNAFYTPLYSANAHIVISDMAGREMVKVKLAENSNNFSFNISHLLDGIYHVKLIVDEQILKNLKLTVIR